MVEIVIVTGIVNGSVIEIVVVNVNESGKENAKENVKKIVKENDLEKKKEMSAKGNGTVKENENVKEGIVDVDDRLFVLIEGMIDQIEELVSEMIDGEIIDEIYEIEIVKENLI